MFQKLANSGYFPPSTRPTPISAPTWQCVVETGIPIRRVFVKKAPPKRFLTPLGGGAFLITRSRAFFKTRPPKMTKNHRFSLLFTSFFAFFSRLRRSPSFFSSFLTLSFTFSSLFSLFDRSELLRKPPLKKIWPPLGGLS